MKKFLQGATALLTLWLAAGAAFASDVTGDIKSANGSPVVNGSLTFELSQAGIVPGSFALVGSSVACATSTLGQVVGVPNPLVAPSVAPSLASGTIPAATYYVRISYVTFDAMAAFEFETLSSPASVEILSGTGRLDVTGPTVQPSFAEGYRVYVGTVSGSEKLQATVTGFGSTQITSYNSGAANDPASNNTVCDLTFNDSIIPYGTTYLVTLKNVNGANLPGFPQRWHLAGASIDVSNQYPVAAVSNQTRFPTPILANPSSNALQSVASPLTLNGYSATAGSLILPRNAAPPSCDPDMTVFYTNSSDELVICEDGSPLSGFFAWLDDDTDSLIGGQLLIEERAIVNPAAGTFLQLYFDTSGDKGHLKAYDYTGALSKSIVFDSALEMNAKRLSQAQGADIATGGASCVSGDCTLGPDGNYFVLTGTTAVDGFATADWQAGSIITVKTTGSVTLNNAGTVAGGFGQLLLVGAANVSMTANDLAMFVFDGTAWHQMAPTMVK